MKYIKRVRDVEMGMELHYDLFLPETHWEKMLLDGLMSTAMASCNMPTHFDVEKAGARDSWTQVEFLAGEDPLKAVLTVGNHSNVKHEEFDVFVGLCCPQDPTGSVDESEPYGSYDNDGSVSFVLLDREGKISFINFDRFTIPQLACPSSVWTRLKSCA